MTLREARPAEFASIRALLAGHGLPTADLETPPLPRMWVAHDGSAVVAAIGLEQHGDSGLLRSLAVAPGLRTRGLGSSLVETLESAARAAGLVRLFLLTETAERFFARRGYARIERSSVPVAIRATAEFSALCPASACCMAKSLP